VKGRKPLPSHLKLVKGTFRKRSSNANEPALKPLDQAPMPPEMLTIEALEEWHRVTPELVAAGVLTAAERTVLACYCQAFGRWKRAEAALERFAAGDPVDHGLVVTAGNGTSIPNPMLAIANQAARDVVRFAADLGLTPSSRGKVIAKPPQKQDPAQKYLT
jgi:P27 family predicted phage terminase small subunit